jgi:3-methyladenine DNA glycosylase AlkD
MTPLPPGALEHLLKTLPPEQEERFPHLADLSADHLLQRRVVITGQLKTLEQERQAIDATLLEVFSAAEMRFGVRAPGGWVLRQRSRTSWDYCSSIRDAIKTLQKQAQRDGRAQPLVITYLVATQENN